MQAKVREYMKALSVPQATVAAEATIGCQSIISQWLNSKYVGNVESVEEKMQQWLESRKEEVEMAETSADAAPMSE